MAVIIIICSILGFGLSVIYLYYQPDKSLDVKIQEARKDITQKPLPEHIKCKYCGCVLQFGESQCSHCGAGVDKTQNFPSQHQKIVVENINSNQQFNFETEIQLLEKRIELLKELNKTLL